MILIRADANEKMGAGHLMRCLSIARAFVECGEMVTFITADQKGDKLVKQNGFVSICLNTNWANMDEEIQSVIKIIYNTSAHLLLIDSYYVTERYFIELSSHIKLAYLDDLNRATWKVDYLINYNVYADVFNYSLYKKKKVELVLGPTYAPLRNEFKRLGKHRIKDKVTDVLVSAGGADPEEIIERIAKELCPSFNSICFHFLIGQLNPRIEELKKLEKDNVVLHINEKDMSGLMKKCDIALSAAGTTLYELCATGIPTLTYSVADNQILPTEQFKTQRVMLSAGDCRHNHMFIDTIKELIEVLINDFELRKALSLKMQALVDGNGSNRLASILIGSR